MPIGVTIAKKINPITKGETIFAKIIPILNQNLFNGVKNLEFNNPNTKKINEINKDHSLISSPFING